MVVGFNHNVRYKGEIFHIQTEDSGICNPHIITLLYRGGIIISSKKTSYADILKIETLEQIVEELMKDQHKDMLRCLKSGKFDERAFTHLAAASVSEQTVPPVSSIVQSLSGPPVAPSASPQKSTKEAVSNQQSLDKIILDYLVAGDDK